MHAVSAADSPGSPAGRRTYDHRVRNAVVAGVDPSLVRRLRIPRSTVRSWVRRGALEVVRAAGDSADTMSAAALEVENARLRRRIDRLTAIARFLMAFIRAMGWRGNSPHDANGVRDPSGASNRIPSATSKERILDALQAAANVVDSKRLLAMVGLSERRVRGWKRRRRLGCSLEDAPPCPRVKPARLTPVELLKMKEYVLAEELRHISIRSLALLAARRGELVASAGTWYRWIKARGWKRLSRRLYPAKPKAGIRAAAPNEIWHIDASVVRLLNGARVYLHAIVDNFSRKVLAFRVETTMSAATTRAMVVEALDQSGVLPDHVRVLTDGGTENVGISEVGDVIKHVIAQVDITQSNSMVEALWRQMKHRWLYLHTLDTVEAVRKIATQYVSDVNELIPRVELGGRTPDEAYRGEVPDLEQELRVAGVKSCAWPASPLARRG